MQLEDYFEFEKFDTEHGPVERIRIKGHRIRIENVIEYFNKGTPPDTIQRDAYPTLTLEEVYAAITYYLHNKVQVDEYIQQVEKVADGYYQQYLAKGPYFLRDAALAERASQQAVNNDDP